jgi:hypothetical protein
MRRPSLAGKKKKKQQQQQQQTIWIGVNQF